MYKTTLKIDGMMCGMCESHINDTIRKAVPVKKVSSSHTRGEAVVITDEPLDVEAVKAAMRSRAPRASPMKKSDSPFSGNERSPSIPEAPSCPHAGRAGFSMCGLTDENRHGS